MGSTNKTEAKLATRVIMAKNYAAVEFEKAKKDAHGKKCMRKGAYDEMLKEASTKYDLPKEFKLSKKKKEAHT